MGSNNDLTELINAIDVSLCPTMSDPGALVNYFSEKVCYEDFLDKIKDRMGERYEKTTFTPNNKSQSSFGKGVGWVLAILGR